MSKPKLLNIIGHDIFEAKNLELFSSLGFEVQSTGAYSDPNNMDPTKSYLPKVKANFNDDLVQHFKSLNPSGYLYGRDTLQLDKTFLDKFDVVLFSWIVEPLIQNFNLLKKPGTFYQTFGQSDSRREDIISQLRSNGIPVIRMSESERNFPNYAGSDAVIDLHIDTNFYKGWSGEEKFICTINSAFSKRRLESNTEEYLKVTNGLPRKLYGTHNKDLQVNFNHGSQTSEELLRQLQINRLFFSLGTKPCPAVLSFKEAMSTGCPVITWGPKLGGPTFSAHTFIENGENGFYSDDLAELRSFAVSLLNDHDLAKRISLNSRETAVKYFGMDIVGPKWLQLFKQEGITL